MKKIYKYKLTSKDLELELPAGAKILQAKFATDGSLCLWAVVTPGSETVHRYFKVLHTNDEVDDDLQYINSASNASGFNTVHVFEVMI